MWKNALAAALLTLAAGAALAGDVTPYDKALATQQPSAKKAPAPEMPAPAAACGCQR